MNYSKPFWKTSRRYLLYRIERICHTSRRRQGRFGIIIPTPHTWCSFLIGYSKTFTTENLLFNWLPVEAKLLLFFFFFFLYDILICRKLTAPRYLSHFCMLTNDFFQNINSSRADQKERLNQAEISCFGRCWGIPVQWLVCNSRAFGFTYWSEFEYIWDWQPDFPCASKQTRD